MNLESESSTYKLRNLCVVQLESKNTIKTYIPLPLLDNGKGTFGFTSVIIIDLYQC